MGHHCYTADRWGNYGCKHIQLISCGAWEAEPDGCDAADRGEIDTDSVEVYYTDGDCPGFQWWPWWVRLYRGLKGKILMWLENKVQGDLR